MEEKKWPKQAALYIEKKGTDYQCEDCHFYKNGLCTLFNDKVESYGTCGLWVFKTGKPDTDIVGTVTKAEAGYEEHKEGFSCKRCEYFDSGNNSCEQVEGRISPDGCCNRWELNDDDDEPKKKIRIRVKK
jgi:hypothetical protein